MTKPRSTVHNDPDPKYGFIDYRFKYDATAFRKILANYDFPMFCRFITIKPKKGKLISFAPEHWFPNQVQFDRERTGKDIVVKGRQVGMTQEELIRDLFYALSRPMSRVGIIATNEGLAKKLIGQIREYYDRLCVALAKLGLSDEFPSMVGRGNDPRLKSSALILKFANGSEIEGITAGVTDRTAQNSGRGLTFNRLHCTEVAYWSLPEETMNAALDALGEGTEGTEEYPTELVLESTPKAAGDYFYLKVKQAQRGDIDWKLHFFKWWEHPDYVSRNPYGEIKAQNEYEQKMLDMGIAGNRILFWRSMLIKKGNDFEKMLTEYPLDIDSCFIAAGTGIVNSIQYEKLKKLIVEPREIIQIRGIPVRIYDEPKYGFKFIIGSDIGSGFGGDDSTACVINASTMQIAACANTNRVPPNQFGEFLCDLGAAYNMALVAPESNEHGHSTVGKMKELEYPSLYKSPKSKWSKLDNHRIDGFNTNVRTRAELRDIFLECISSDSIEYLDKELFDQICNLEVIEGKLVARGKGKGGKDDLFLAYCIALHVRDSGASFSNQGLSFQSLAKRVFTKDFWQYRM